MSSAETIFEPTQYEAGTADGLLSRAARARTPK
jgi:hypothetical protein